MLSGTEGGEAPLANLSLGDDKVRINWRPKGLQICGSSDFREGQKTRQPWSPEGAKSPPEPESLTSARFPRCR